MMKTANIHGTDGVSFTEVLPGIEDTRRKLIAMRVRHGADSAIGHRASNIIECLKNGANPARQVAELERLLRDFQ